MTYLDDIAAKIRAELSPEDLPDEDDVEELLKLYALLAHTKGTAVTNEDIHDAWVLWMSARDPAHEALKPYRDLDPETRREDDPFTAAVRAVAARLA